MCIRDRAEIDHPGFWEFIDEAINSFLSKKGTKPVKLEDETPWAKLGEKWHFMRKGFDPGKIKWKPEVLEVLHAVIQEAAPQGQFLWNNKQEVHVFLPQQKEPWVSIQTKRPDGVWLQVAGPKDSVTAGQVAELADDPKVSSEDNRDVCLLYTSPSPRDATLSRMPSSA